MRVNEVAVADAPKRLQSNTALRCAACMYIAGGKDTEAQR